MDCSGHFAEEANAAEKISVGDPCAREDHFFPGARSRRVVDSLWIFHAHFLEALRVLRLRKDEAAENLSFRQRKRPR